MMRALIMDFKGLFRIRIKTQGVFFIFVITVLFTFFPMQISAKVSGPCVNCHTMHASQGGALPDTWDLTNAPRDNLLANNCVGCHSSSTGDTIINTGGSSIPIVYNSSVPATPLAGGNFYWVSNASYGDAYGHNVYGIADPDSALSEAPGRTIGGCTNSCHDTLADPPGTDNKDKGGCQGCHVFTAHHDDSRPWYRFLKGHAQPPFGSTAKEYSDYVIGNEDDDWEQETSSDHNWYKGTTSQYTEGNALGTYNTITSFCQGCHGVFHGTPDQPSAGDGMGAASPWIRHPTDIALPQGDGSEYAAYDPTTGYSAVAPVAWTDPSNASNRGTPIVMCLSCHRPHGTNQPDMLRWDYNTMDAGGGGSGGCFTCHTTKN